MFAIAANDHAQSAGQKVVEVTQWSQIHDAVLISDVSVAGNHVECGLFIKPPLVIQPVTPFQAGSDWLQHMTISLVNRTNKTIVFGSVIFRFLDTGDCRSQACAMTSLGFGQMPAVDAYDGRTGQPFKLNEPQKPAIQWTPEQTIQLQVIDYTGEIERTLDGNLSVSAISKLAIDRGVFYFDDGMRWDQGRFGVPDPDHHGKFKELPADYFPGKRGHNWPPGYFN